MTAEIAILNRSAVALAADSAVTISTPTGPKIYDSVNKLFVLAKQRPVGIMIYNSADLLGLPWETIIKAYRMHRRNKPHDALEEYAADFLDFVAVTPELIYGELQDQYFAEASIRRLQSIRLRVDQSVDERLRAGEKLSQTKLRKIIDEAIAAELQQWDKQPDGPWLTTMDLSAIERRYSGQFDALMAQVLQKLPIVARQKVQIRRLLVRSLGKEPYWHTGIQGPIDPQSGLVIAGFGEKEFFPRLLSFEVSGVVDGTLRVSPRENQVTSPDNSAIVAPFAQGDMVDSFVTGINPVLSNSIGGYLRSIEEAFPDAVLKLVRQQLPAMGDAEAATLHGSLRSLVLLTIRGFTEHLNQLQNEQVMPILNSVAFLPKDELAAMAESLVNLTSLKRRVSQGPQTVGGPVDVAVISRGDGFVWIKRKHYFSQDLNPSWAVSHAEG
jgi:hypothetical protein